MSQENFLWGAPRIHGELLKLGFDVSQATVSRSMPRRGYPLTQTWRTFLRNQAFAIGTIGLGEAGRLSDELLTQCLYPTPRPFYEKAVADKVLRCYGTGGEGVASFGC